MDEEEADLIKCEAVDRQHNVTAYMSQAFLEEFIQLYRKHPCLWKTKSKVYKDRQLMSRAYMELEEKMQEIDPAAGLDTVKLRISSLRSCYRKEFRLVKKSLESAKNGGQLYVPKLWYFRLMTFVSEDDYPELNELLDCAAQGFYLQSCQQKRSVDDFRRMPRSLIRELLTEFRANECLWKVNSSDYTNRRAKMKAYDRLVVVCRKYVPNADRTLVKNIIASSRSSYRREIRKMLQSSAEGKDVEIYMPRLWYFSLMTFLNEEDIPDLASLMDSFQEEPSSIYATESVRQRRKRRKRLSSPDPTETHDSDLTETHDSDPMETHDFDDVVGESSRLDDSDDRRAHPDDAAEEFGRSHRNRLLCDAIAETVSLKLRSLSRLQRIVAEKLINDVLFNAELERLNARSTLLVTDQDRLAD